MIHGLYISFWLPTVVLGAALAIKLPSILKLWRDPLLRAVGGLLLFACAVFVFAAPKTIAWTNRVTGVPNIAAPWVYSLLTALSASWLLLVIAWRNNLTERSAQTRRATRWVVSVYAGVVVALWVLFALADVPVERIRDLDTYYATTPFMREEILLYLLAHTVACSVTAGLIWNWSRTEGLDAWLRWGLRFLGAGYVTNLLFSAAKLTAVVARWTGHDLDWLNTNIAPSAACVAATLVAIGFIVPHAGQYLQERWRVRRLHRGLKPLARLMRSAVGSREPLALRATPELRLIRRETFIRDAVLQLARHLDDDLRRRSYDAAVALGFDRGRAQALAAAVTIQEAVATLDHDEPREGTGANTPSTVPEPGPTAPEPGGAGRGDAAPGAGGAALGAGSAAPGAGGAGLGAGAAALGAGGATLGAGAATPGAGAATPGAGAATPGAGEAGLGAGAAALVAGGAGLGARSAGLGAGGAGLGVGSAALRAGGAVAGARGAGPRLESAVGGGEGTGVRAEGSVAGPGAFGSPGTPAHSAPSEPAASAPAPLDPAASDPDASDPAPLDPAASDPDASDPAPLDPDASDPDASDPAPLDPAVSGPDASAGVSRASRREDVSRASRREDGGFTAGDGAGTDTTYLLREIQAVSEVLRHPDDIDAVRELAVRPGREHLRA